MGGVPSIHWRGALQFKGTPPIYGRGALNSLEGCPQFTGGVPSIHWRGPSLIGGVPSIPLPNNRRLITLVIL